MPKTRIEFGFNGEYSSEHWLEYMDIPILPKDFELRYDVPHKDDDGRWARNNDGTVSFDGGDPIRAKVESSEGQVCSYTQTDFACVCVMVEVEGGKDEIKKVEDLLEFRAYLKRFENAKRQSVTSDDSGFSSDQSHFLQQRMCGTVADAAKLFIGSFHKSDKKMICSIEQVLKEKWGLMFACGPEWFLYIGPSEEASSKKPKKK